jgi:hypothetical protein
MLNYRSIIFNVYRDNITKKILRLFKASVPKGTVPLGTEAGGVGWVWILFFRGLGLRPLGDARV